MVTVQSLSYSLPDLRERDRSKAYMITWLLALGLPLTILLVWGLLGRREEALERIPR